MLYSLISRRDSTTLQNWIQERFDAEYDATPFTS